MVSSKEFLSKPTNLCGCLLCAITKGAVAAACQFLRASAGDGYLQLRHRCLTPAVAKGAGYDT